MCTVTFIPTTSGVLITSNRDEKIQRSVALPPMFYQLNGIGLVYPKDPDAAGTWIAMQDAGQFGVLLNGAFQKHEPAYPYNRSRGLVFLDIVASADMDTAFREIDLGNIEPFTIILFRPGSLTVNRWDGLQKLVQPVPADQPHIWSSATLYDEAMVREREEWFRDWKSLYPNPNVSNILDFHLFGGKSNDFNNIRMNRHGQLLTVSITCIEAGENGAAMHYTDLQNGEKHHAAITYKTVPQLHS
ncbi:NRDE family protein [Flavihumibacter fluvii]|uniref:NRDE family protein n=1 Tax=Flavihumibacter fluvii TaxID=2838157 RepID=UPI001BDF1B7F|nr:NRDE family protein [Flavihumibacter fluvii]ULQ54369.1 NRDE family protein [Flavihumibacter fluvii]